MARRAVNPSDAMREMAREFGDVEEGMSCSQTSFKRAGKAFLYVGEQGGREKAMFKLKGSLGEARERAAGAPEDYQVGSNGWVTARFSREKPLGARVWKKWLRESYELAGGGKGPGKACGKR